MEASETPEDVSIPLPIRDQTGRVRFSKNPEILREFDNLGRRMLVLRFDDGATFLFSHEVKVFDERQEN